MDGWMCMQSGRWVPNSQRGEMTTDEAKRKLLFIMMMMVGERRDQVEQPYAGRVPCDGVTAEPLCRRCPRRFAAAVLIARPAAAASTTTISHTVTHRDERDRERRRLLV